MSIEPENLFPRPLCGAPVDPLPPSLVPARTPLEGRHVRLEPMDPTRHGEDLYQVTFADPGFLSLDLVSVGSGVDVDVHILDADDPDACIDRGHWSAGALLDPGTYIVVVDSWADGSTTYDGSYTLQLGHTSTRDLEDMGMATAAAENALHAFDAAHLCQPLQGQLFQKVKRRMHVALWRSNACRSRRQVTSLQFARWTL